MLMDSETNCKLRQTLILQGDTIVVGEEPLLSREVVEALPNLHANTVCGALKLTLDMGTDKEER